MKLSRIMELRRELDAERISMGELIEIQGAFEELDPATLREPAEHALAGDMLDELEAAARWQPQYESWRHGGWYVMNVRYPSGAVGCVSRNYPDRKWRIVCHPLGFDDAPTFKTRDEAARAERALVASLPKPGDVVERGGREVLVQSIDYHRILGRFIAEDGTIDELANVPLMEAKGEDLESKG